MFDATGCIEDDAGEQHRRGVARNFAMVHRAARSLGGVPEMLSAGDFLEHGLDERAVILYVSFLCSRLLEVSREERAAHTIQEAWRNHKANSIGGWCLGRVGCGVDACRFGLLGMKTESVGMRGDAISGIRCCSDSASRCTRWKHGTGVGPSMTGAFSPDLASHHTSVH
jgi:hypothetical protein